MSRKKYIVMEEINFYDCESGDPYEYNVLYQPAFLEQNKNGNMEPMEFPTKEDAFTYIRKVVKGKGFRFNQAEEVFKSKKEYGSYLFTDVDGGIYDANGYYIRQISLLAI